MNDQKLREIPKRTAADPFESGSRRGLSANSFGRNL
jgi:hypothetical protein